MESNQKMKFWSIVLLTINSIIGTGIFLSPGAVAKLVGSKAAIIYLAAAVFAAVLAVTFAAASKYVVKSGAAYAYAKAGFGDEVGSYVGITRAKEMLILSCSSYKDESEIGKKNKEQKPSIYINELEKHIQQKRSIKA